MQMGKCLTWEDHWAASWKNLTSFHSTPSMRTVGTRPPDLPAPLSRLRLRTRVGGADTHGDPHAPRRHSLVLIGPAGGGLGPPAPLLALLPPAPTPSTWPESLYPAASGGLVSTACLPRRGLQTGSETPST